MVVKLKEIASIQMGISFRSRLENDPDGDIGVIQMKDLTELNEVDTTDLIITEIKNLKLNHIVQPGDLIFRSRGLVTNSAIAINTYEPCVAAAPLFTIKILDKEIISPEYLNWFLDQPDAQNYFSKNATGSAQKMIGKEVLENLNVIYPSMITQNKIVELDQLSKKEMQITHNLLEKKRLFSSILLMKMAKGK